MSNIAIQQRLRMNNMQNEIDKLYKLLGASKPAPVHPVNRDVPVRFPEPDVPVRSREPLSAAGD